MNNVIIMQWVEIIILSFVTMMMCFNAHAYSGRTDAECCHASGQSYHCHDSGGLLGCPTGSGKLNEGVYDLLFCNSVDGKTETLCSYISGRDSHIKVDCKTENTVYEGRLDKRSSLDSVRQALFFSSLTGKKPAATI